MNERLRELLARINALKSEITNLVDAGKLDEAKAKKEELEALQAQFDILKDVLDPNGDGTVPLPDNNITPADEAHDAVHDFANAARRGFVNLMSEGTNADGGYTVPEDIQTRINHYKEANFSMRSLVSVEPVRTDKGARTYQTKAQAAGFAKVAESGQVQEAAGPQYERVTYSIEDYAGYMPVTNDLLADSDANIVGEITNWIGRNSLMTDNNEVIAILKGKAETEFEELADMKKAINVTLGQPYRAAVVIVTNDDGLNYLDTLEDANKRPLLNPNPTEPNRIQLRVGATVVPIEVVPNTVLSSDPVYTLTSDRALVSGKTYYTRTGSGTEESPYVYTPVASPDVSDIATYYEVSDHKIPFIIGDLKEAVRIFDRQQTIILSSQVASVTGFNAFEQRGTLFRAEIRADYKPVDEDAWVYGYIALGE